MDELVDDNFLNMADDFKEYIKYLRLIFTDYSEVVESFDNIIEKNVFDKKTYIEFTGMIKYTSKRIFPLLSAFFGQDENFENDIYRIDHLTIRLNILQQVLF